jgi:hypothetical protein
MSTAKELFGLLNPALQAAFNLAQCGYRTVSTREPFFETAEAAERFGKRELELKPEYGGHGWSTIVLVEFRDGQRLGLTTIADFARAQRQVETLLAAHDITSHEPATDPYTLRKTWAAWFLSK